MQPLRYVLRNRCSLLKNGWTIPMRNFIAVFYTTRTMVLCSDSEFQTKTVETISQNPEVPGFPGSRVPGVSRGPWDPEELEVSGSHGYQGSWESRRSWISQGHRGLGGPRTGSYFSTIPKLRHNNLIQPFLFVPEWAHIELLTQGWHF